MPWGLLVAGVLVLLLGREPDPAGEPPPEPVLTGPELPSRTTVVGGLLVVGALLAVLPRMLHAVRAGRADAGGRSIEILEVRPLGGRRSLLLARVGSQRVLIGSSEAGLQPLARLDAWAPFSVEGPEEEGGPEEGGVLLRVEPSSREEAWG